MDGIITDDSDIFLFGGTNVFKNMFNQAKYVEKFRLEKIESIIHLSRDQLIQMAYLLGSDYTQGIKGIGPKMATEILKVWNGQGLGPLCDFKAYCDQGAQETHINGQAIPNRIIKLAKRVDIDQEFPVRQVFDAYHHPTIDSTPTPFRWGKPQLDAVRDYMKRYCGWKPEKTDAALIPVIKEMSQTQTTLDRYLSPQKPRPSPSKKV